MNFEASISGPIVVNVDETSLGDEQGEIYLFQWLASNEKALRQAKADDLKSSQEILEASLIKVITATSPYPLPGRPIRNLVAQCFIALYTQGDTKSLFDTIQALLKVAGEQKAPVQDAHRTAAMCVIGELMRVFGAQVMSLVVDTVTMCMKLNKSSNTILLRYHAMMALEKTLFSAKRAVTDSLMRDILKQMKHAIADKALPLVRAATKVLVLMYPSDDGTRSVADVESLVVLCVKHLDAADIPTRTSLSKFVAHLLASTQVERVIPPVEASKKGKKSAEEKDEEDDSPGTTHVPSGEVKLIMSPNEMLLQLSAHLNKPQTSHKTRIGIFACYLALLSVLGSSFIERNYALVVDHLMTEVVLYPRNSNSRYDTLVVRKLVGLLLRDLIGVRMLSEQGQIFAIQELSSAYLKRWPAMMPGQTAPASSILVVALREVAGLLQQLGNAPPPVQEALLEPLMSLLSHPNHTVRVSAAWTLRCFCYSTPLRLPKTLINLVEMLQNDVASLVTPVAPSDINVRALGHAYGLTALLALIPQRPLYVSYDINANVFYMSVQLLKRAGEHDVQVARVEVEIAWTMIASLMTMGPNFVRAHLPQLLVLWRNALPKPTTKEASSERTSTEWIFLLHVRENALRAVYHFLQHNSSLVTTDVARRIASLLGNALQFANMFLSQHVQQTTDVIPGSEEKGLTLPGIEALLRSRIFQCFLSLDLPAVTEVTQTTLLQSTMALFASPEGYSGSSVQAAIASSSGAFTNIWQSIDGYAYGVTDLEADVEPAENSADGVKDWLNRDPIEAAVDDMCQKPITRSLEHDPLTLCQSQSLDTKSSSLEFPPPATAAVNAAITLFARLLPIQDSTSLSHTVTKLLELVGSAKLEKISGRKAAVLTNTTVALALAFRQATSHSRHMAHILSNSQITSSLATFLKDVLVDGDFFLRRASSEAIGRLASLAGTNFLTGQIKTLVNEVVANRNPNGRAGCALAFGAIHGHVGGLAAGPLLKTTIHVLMSLINDPHPVVHFWALRALSRVIDAASLAYASYVPSTLGLLFKIYMLDSHEPEGGSLGYVNMSGDLPVYQAICQNIDAVITVVGPDIQDSVRTRTLIMDLVQQFIREEEEGVCVEAMKCVQHFLMFAPEHVEVPKLVTQFRGYLSSTQRPLKMASINALYQLVQKDAILMSKLGGDRLVEELFAMLDDDSSVDGVRSVITSWLEQTVVHNPSAWIDLCQRIMSRTTASQEIANAVARGNNLADDEGQSLSLDSSGDAASVAMRPTARWRTQLFALQCLHKICILVAQTGRREHIDLGFARSQNVALSGLLVTRIADLIKIAFTASAAHVMEIRLEGLVVLQDVIEIFSQSPDPDYENVSLLEQHQAPITAALTPAFSADSTPEILASAIKCCAVFVGSGVIKDVTKMGRILKLLVSALEQCKDPGMLHLGDAAELGPNASVMLRVATLSAWAELKVASHYQNYLSDVISPHMPKLGSLWIAALGDFANVRVGAEEDISAGGLDSSYTSLGRDVILPYYLNSWPTILHAVSIAMWDHDPYILAAMDGSEELVKDDNNKQPVTFFWVIFGLVYEVLATSSADTDVSNHGTIVALQALNGLMEKSLSGEAFKDFSILEELMNVFYRMALTETIVVRIQLLRVLSTLSKNLATLSAEDQYSSVSLMHCLRICAHITRSLVNAQNSTLYGESAYADKIMLVNTAFEAFCIIASACSNVQYIDCGMVGLTLYSELLRSEASDVDLVGPSLQSLKLLLEQFGSADIKKFEKVIHGMLSACLINISEMRGRRGLPCSRKIKSNLLAIVLIITSMSPSVRIGASLLEQCCSIIVQKLLELDEDVSVTAAQCIRTFTVASTSGNITLRQGAKLLLPGMIRCVTQIAASSSSSEYSQRDLLIIGEIWKSFIALFSMIPENHRASVLAVFLPTMMLVLEPSRSPSVMHVQTVNQLLSFATSDPVAFKNVTATFDTDMRARLEESVKWALSSNTQSGSEIVRPQISLRSF